MCGIVGLVCKSQYGFTKKQEDVFWHLLKADEVRGDDSTGLIYVENDGGFGILKEATTASWSAYTMYADSLLSDSIRKGKVYIGHNRKATVGKVTDETAHPFVVDDTFAMVHNGTLYNHKKMKDTTVDSEALAHHLKPILTGNLSDDELNEKMGEIDGAYAVVAYDQESHSVFLVRNAQRPLYLVELPDGWAWASEGLMLAWIAQRNGYDLSKCTAEDVKEHTIIKIDLDKNTITRREYSPKKAISKVDSLPWNKSGGSTEHVPTKQVPRFQDTGISKNEFKRMRRRFLGTRHSFYADDFVEKNFPRTLEDGETVVKLLGEFDGECFAGIDLAVHAEIDLSAVFGKDSFTEEDITNRFYHGIIDDLVYNKSARNVVFILKDVKVYAKSSDVQAEVKKILATTQGKWNAQTPPTVH